MKRNIFALILVVMLLFSPFAEIAQAVDQGATTLIRDCWRMEDDSWPQWNYGNRSVSFSDDFTVTNTYFPSGGLVEIDLALAGGSVTVYTDDPIMGDGSIGDPIDLSTAVAGNGLSMTTNYIDVNVGDGVFIDAFDNVAVGWGDGAGHRLYFDTTTLDADTTYTWDDPVAGGYLYTDGSGNIGWDTTPGSTVYWDRVATGRPYVIPTTDTDDIWTEGQLSVAGESYIGGPLTVGTASIVIDGGDDSITASGGTLTLDSHVDVTGTFTASGITYPSGVPGGNDYLCIFDTDGSTELVPQASVVSVESLDEAYDEGNTIDYTGASTVADAVVLSASTGEDPGAFLTMLMDTVYQFIFGTNGEFIARNAIAVGVPLSIDHAIDMDFVVFNENGNNVDFRVETDNHNNAFYIDADVECVSIVPTEYIGDGDTAGDWYQADGSANYIHFVTQAMSADWTWTWPTGIGTAGQALTVDGSIPGKLEFTTQVDIKSKVSSDDTTAGYLDGKLVAGTGILLTQVNGGGDETLLVTNTVVDTDYYAICIGDTTTTAITNISAVAIAYPSCVPHTGTAKYTGVYIQQWTPDLTSVDTITFTLYVNGVAKDSWTTNAGAAGAYGGAVDEALTQGQYVDIRAQVTTVVGSLDTIKAQSVVVDVQIS